MALSSAVAALHNRKLQALIAAGFNLLVLIGLWNASPTRRSTTTALKEDPVRQAEPPSRLPHIFLDGSVYKKPAATKIYGLVFYGRFDRVQILDCYLKKNLARNGGFLEKVVFISNTREPSDQEALGRILRSEPNGYVLGKTIAAHEDTHDFHNIWEGLEPDVLYVKIDDDILYIHDDAVPSLIRYRMEHPEYFMVSANVINNPALSWVHERMGAIHPFLPGKTPPKGFKHTAPVVDWKVSLLPLIRHSDLNVDSEIPNRPHRWLPVDTETDILRDKTNDKTPIARAEYSAWGPGWNDWRLAAQQHYSFFQNAEKGEDGLRNYWFRRWDMNYDRLSINFIAIWGKDVIDSFPIPRDDEAHLTQDIPKKLGRHVVVDGDSLAAHYSYKQQKEGLVNTDILERYRAFAKENCGKLLE